MLSPVKPVRRLGERGGRYRRRQGAIGGRRVIVLATAALLFLVVVLLQSVAVEFVRREAWRLSLRVAVPSCPSSPWKADEDLRGDCRPDVKPLPGGADITVAECARSCCEDAKCVSWQHRRDVGCLHGGDFRLGMEKDSVSAWCSDHPPKRWKGQFLVGRGGGDAMEDISSIKSRELACDESTWNPEEEVGQCFGLGDVRPEASGSASECMRACCKDATCSSWQWNEVVSASWFNFLFYNYCFTINVILLQLFFFQ